MTDLQEGVRHRCPECGSRAAHRAWGTGGFFTCADCSNVFKPTSEVHAEILHVLGSTAGLARWSQDERNELADRLAKAVGR